MPVTQDRLTRLREFGLSEYAARSYLALLDLGIAEARDVSSISKVPQAKIYHVLEQLHDKGLVVILPEFPKKYAPVPFEEYLGRLFDEHTKAAQSIDEQRNDLAEMFRVMGDTDVGDRGFFTVIRGRRNVLGKIEEMIAQTQKDLVILGTSGTAERASHMLAELRRARDRHVRVRMLAPVDHETVEKLAQVAQLSELRARELGDEEQSAKVAIVVSDSTRAFLIHFVPDDANLHSGKDIGVFTDQEAMVAAIQAIVEPHWARSGKYERRREDIAHGRTPEFTRIYTSDQEAREALAVALDAGAREGLIVNGFTFAGRTPSEFLSAERTRRRVASWRAIVELPDIVHTEEWSKLAQDKAIDVRHARAPTPARQLVLDGREAFYAIGSAEERGEVVVHTNAPAVVDALRAHFTSLWGMSATLDERRHELSLFPGLQPRDVGIGRLFHLLRDAVIVADVRDVVVLWNPAAATIFRRSTEEARGLAITEIVAPDARKSFLERLQRFREKGEPDKDADFFEVEALRQGGERFPAEITMSLIRAQGSSRFVVAVVRDITARRNAQKAELEFNKRVQRAYERMNEAFYALDRDWRFVYRNPVVRKMQGARADEEIDGRVIWEAFPDLQGTKFETELKRAAREMRPVAFIEHYPRMARWFEVTAYPSEEGLSIYFRDVTQHQLATSLLTSTLDGSPDGILVVSREGTVGASNVAFREMWGIPPTLANQGDNLAFLRHMAHQVEDPEAFEQRLRELNADPGIECRDEIRLKDGRVFERYSKPQRVEGVTIGRVCSFRELTREDPEIARARPRSARSQGK